MEEYDVIIHQALRICQKRYPQRQLSHNRASKRLPEECCKATEKNSVSENTNSELLRKMSQARVTQKQGKKPFYLLRGKHNTQVEYKQATNHSLSCYSTACKLNLRGKISTLLKAPTVLGSTLRRSSYARASNKDTMTATREKQKVHMNVSMT